ncbi:NAD-dependent succinate-semialdehyde dehydrogenase [Peribacillus butanolivorans]|uniref:NAD-dependent succinate-semialdehyde dehydrogenase n=1 Tax=Peribacillus butanolivorans TaxID=421767 RepID=UPI0035E14C3C
MIENISRISVENKLYIGGEWINAISNKTFEVLNPATGELIREIAYGVAEDAKSATDAATEAFESWAETTADQRNELLMKWFNLVKQNKEEIAKLLTLEQGKSISEAHGEVNYAASYISWYAEECKRVYGETIPASSINKRIIVLKQPIGVVAAITPWNFPAAMFTRKVATAVAAGCTIVVKPAEATPLTAIKLTELAHEAGIPKGVINLVTGDPKTIGESWLKDQRIKKLTFTGSTAVGKYLMRESADTVKKLSLELGGHAPFIIFEDADIDLAVEEVLNSKFRNSGQTCICANRIYVQKNVLEEFKTKFVAKTKKIKVGIGTEPGVDIGPLINENGFNKVQDQVEDAISKGAIIETGGQRLIDFKNGYFFEPTILSGVTEEMKISYEETFGPVAPIFEFESVEEVIAKANNSEYGLAAYAFTKNLNLAIKISEKLEYGIVGINDGLPSTAQAPFGGIKNSGLGREGGHHGLDEFLEHKYISIKI